MQCIAGQEEVSKIYRPGRSLSGVCKLSDLSKSMFHLLEKYYLKQMFKSYFEKGFHVSKEGKEFMI